MSGGIYFIPGQNAQTQALLSQLGMPGNLIADQAASLPPFALFGLHQAYMQALGPTAFVPGGQIPPFLQMPNPQLIQPVTGPVSGAGYAGGDRMRLDIAGPGVGDGWWARHTDGRRIQAGQFEKYLKDNDYARSMFEQSVGGKIVGWGDHNDGKFTIERFRGGQQPLPLISANPQALTTYQMLQGMDSSVMNQATSMGLLTGVGTGLLTAIGTGNPLMGLLLGGFTGLSTALMGGAFGNGSGQFGGTTLGMGPFGFSGMNGAGFGSLNPLAAPGHLQGSNPAYEAAHQAQVASVLNDPSLSVEDKMMLMLALIMKKMDDDIERQMNYINALQNQQANRQQKGKALGAIGSIAGLALGGPAGAALGGSLGGKLGGGGNQSPSVDVEMQKLQRMITKRAQLFEMASNIMKKYDDTARAAIQKINQ